MHEHQVQHCKLSPDTVGKEDSPNFPNSPIRPSQRLDLPDELLCRFKRAQVIQLIWYVLEELSEWVKVLLIHRLILLVDVAQFHVLIRL